MEDLINTIISSARDAGILYISRAFEVFLLLYNEVKLGSWGLSVSIGEKRSQVGETLGR